MKINISREELLPALQTVNRVVGRRQTLPILSNLLLNVSTESISLTTTDMEVELVATIEKKNKISSDITLPARKLLDICRTLPDGSEIIIEVKRDRALVTSGKSQFTLSTLPAQEYPTIEMTGAVVAFKVAQDKFKLLLDRTAFAMARHDVRYYLNGLLLELTKGKLRAVATDGHRLALCDKEINYEQKEPVQIIVPRKGVTELVRLLNEDSEDIRVRISPNYIHINLKALRFTSKLIDGKFPDYTRVIPKESEYPIITNKEMLRQALTRASILSNEKYRVVRITLEKGRLRALAHNSEQEEAKEEMEVNYNGEDLVIGFNASYLLDALGIIKTEEIQLSVSDPDSSCLILPVGNAEGKYIVMPMRL